MPFTEQDTGIYRRDVDTKGQLLTTDDRAQLLAKYLPDPSSFKQTQGSRTLRRKQQKKRIRPWLKQKVHLLAYLAIQFWFGIFIRTRQIISAVYQKLIAVRHYHHRTPAYIERDLKNLNRRPKHLSVLLKYDDTADDGLETLIDEVAELSAWSVAAGVPLLSVYERTGILKQYMSAVQELVQQKLVQYFGAGDARPQLRVYGPNIPHLSPMPSPRLMTQEEDRSSSRPTAAHCRVRFNLLLLSATDGRDTLVDLTKTLTEMAQAKKLKPKDITVDLIDAEIRSTTSISTSDSRSNSNGSASSINMNGGPVRAPSTTTAMSLAAHTTSTDHSKSELPDEPDLLIVFAPYIKLDGYPPWQIRLTEIFCVGDSGGDVSGRSRTRVEYQSFLRALWKYSGAEFRLGK